MMDIVLFAVTLEESLLQLYILEKCEQIQETPDDIADREKIRRDMGLIKKVFGATISELVQQGSHTTLTETIDALEEREAAFDAASDDNRKLRNAKKEAMVTRRKAKISQYRVLRDAGMRAAVLKDEIEAAKVNAGLQLAFVERWTSARAEMPIPSKSSRSPVPPNAIKFEERVHDEITKLIDIQEQEYQQQIDEWQERYNKDTVDICVRITDLKKKLEIVTAKRIKLEKMYTSREAEINKWLSFKRERAERQEREERERAAAVLMQAWWRGLMVRRGLGAFKNLKPLKKPKGKRK